MIRRAPPAMIRSSASMTYTSFAFLVGCAAISALPPLNGFASEWLTFQAILQSPQLPQWGLKILVPTVGALLALSAALAAACFVKAYGVTFLGRPRSAAAKKAVEADRYSLGAMFVLAALCLLAGILPGFVIDWLAPATLSLVGARMSEFLLVTSTFASAPLLAVLLLTGLLIAFGALMLRLNGLAFGEPSGGTGPVKASYLPIMAHFALVLTAGIYLPPALVAWFQHVAVLLH